MVWMKLMLERVRPFKIVSLRVTHIQTGAAVMLRVFSWRVFVCHSQEYERFGCHNTGGQREGINLQTPHPPCLKFIFMFLPQYFILFPI